MFIMYSLHKACHRINIFFLGIYNLCGLCDSYKSRKECVRKFLCLQFLIIATMLSMKLILCILPTWHALTYQQNNNNVLLHVSFIIVTFQVFKLVITTHVYWFAIIVVVLINSMFWQQCWYKRGIIKGSQ